MAGVVEGVKPNEVGVEQGAQEVFADGDRAKDLG